MLVLLAQHAALSPAGTGVGCDNRGMDATDREILGELMRNGRISYRDLGAAVGLSANAAADRVRRLRREGVITGFTASVDHGAAGRRLVALIDVRLAAAGTNEAFEEEMKLLEPVVDAVHVTGRFDYQLRVACRDTAELDRLLRHLKRDGGATETETRVVLRSAFTRGAP
jgi:Lrp/AsnC family transcriptional regulator, leucine-responsive regulatory protein